MLAAFTHWSSQGAVMNRSRNHLIFPTLGLFLAGALVLGGCGGDDDNGPIPPAFIDETLADDIAQHVGMTLATNNGGWVYGLTAQPATIPLSALAPAGARVAGLSRSLRDTSFTAAGVAWVVADTFFTAGNAPQEDYDPATSTRVSLASFGSGTLSAAQFSAAFQHRIRVGAPGLSATNDTLRFAGSSRDSSRSWFTSTIGTASGAYRRLLCVGDLLWEDVITFKGQAPDAPPRDGFATTTMNAWRYSNGDTTAVEKQASAVIVLIAFDGSSQVTMSVDGHYEYEVNLHTGVVTKF
jgi:hypothetical protein